MKSLQLICVSIFLFTNLIGQNSDNVGFEFGDFTNWDAYTGSCCGGRFIKSGPVNGRHTLMQNQGYDLNSNNTISYLAPGGGKYSVRLGNSDVNSEAERLSTSFLVTADNANFTYMYAVILQDPPRHSYNDKPKFEIRILDDLGNQVPGPCGYYKVTAGYDTDGWEELGETKYKNWTKVSIDLSQYIGKVMTIEFTTEDCGLSGHFGYAYIDAQCGNSDIRVNNFCPYADSITLSAPEGYLKYRWFPGGETTRSIIVRNPVQGDTFRVELTNESGCNAFLTNVLTMYDYPVIDHIPDTTICLGQSVCLKANAKGTGNTYYWWGYSNPVQKLCIKPDSTTKLIVTAKNKNNCYNQKSIDTVTVFVDRHLKFNLCCDRYLCREDTVLLWSPIQSPNYEWSKTPLPPNTIHDSFGYFKIMDESPVSLKVWDTFCAYDNDVNFKFPVNSVTKVYFCEGDTDIRLNAPPAKYWFWSHNGDTTQSSVVHEPIDSQYIYVKLDTLKCTNLFRIQLIKFSEIVPVPVAPRDTLICSGNEIKLIGYDASKSGRAGYWYSDDTCCFQNGTPIYPLKNVQYYFRINSNCKASYIDTFRITINTQAYFQLEKNMMVCFGDSITISPGVNSGSFIWSSYPNGFYSSDSVIRVKPLHKTIYFLTHYNHGCSYSASSTIDLHKRPGLKIKNYCDKPGSLILSADKNYSGYHWMPTNDTTSFTKINIPTSLTEVKLFCTLESGCRDTVFYQLKKTHIPKIQGPNDTMICINGTIQPEVKGIKSGYQYYWYNADSSFFSTKMNPVIRPTHNDWYKVRVTNDSDCYGPESVDSFYVSIDSDVVAVFGKDTIICAGNSILLAPLAGKGNYNWSSFPSGVSSTSKSIYVTPETQTMYILSISDSKCTGSPAFITVSLWNLPSVNAGPNKKICMNSTVLMEVDQKPGITYYWTDNFNSFHSHDPKIELKPNKSTDYYVTVTDSNNCLNKDTVKVMVNPIPIIRFGGKITVCENTPYRLSAFNKNSTYLWSTGLTTASIIASRPGLYSVTVNNGACSAYGEVEIVWLYKKDTLIIPNIFTPNNDGINDLFKITTNNYETFDLTIFNRWGEKVFGSSSVYFGWDGNLTNGKPASDGIYFYTLKLKSNCESENYLSGTVSLFR